MSPESFRSHPLFEKLQQMDSRINESESKEKIDLENLSFFQSANKYIADRLKTTIPILVQEPEINALSSEVDAGLQQINAYLGNNNIGHLTNATNNVNSALNRIRNFPLPFAKTDFDFSKALANFQQNLSEKYDLVEVEKNELIQEINRQKSDLEQKDVEIKRLSKLIEAKEIELQNLNTQFQNDFNTLKSNANKEVENDRVTFRNEIDVDKKTFKTEIEELKGKIDTDTSAIITDFNSKLIEAKKIVNVIGNVGVTGNYQIIANEHKSTANFWRWIAIIFMASFSGLLIWTIIDLSSTGFDWIKSVIRIVAAAALSYPATYAARESSKHRKLETINRTAELELASLSPFIELLPTEKQQTIREKLVEKYFGNNNSEHTNHKIEEEDLSIGGFEKILKAVLPLLKK